MDPDDFPEAAGKVWYVWFDAPIGYLAAVQEWVDAGHGGDDPEGAFNRWWRTDHGAEDVVYTEFMGKDNVPFHTLSFPATILGSGEDWKLVDRLKSFNWLTYYGGKFSTTDQRGVFMSDALDLLPADYWRWYLMSNAPESDDSSFTWELFGSSVNKDLVGTIGNLVNRTVTQVGRHFDDLVPAGGEPGEEEAVLHAQVQERLAEYIAHMDALDFERQPLRSSRCGQPETSTSRPVSHGRRSRSTRTALHALCGRRSNCWCSAPWHHSPSSRRQPKSFRACFPILTGQRSGWDRNWRASTCWRRDPGSNRLGFCSRSWIRNSSTNGASNSVAAKRKRKRKSHELPEARPGIQQGATQVCPSGGTRGCIGSGARFGGGLPGRPYPILEIECNPARSVPSGWDHRSCQWHHREIRSSPRLGTG